MMYGVASYAKDANDATTAAWCARATDALNDRATELDGLSSEEWREQVGQIVATAKRGKAQEATKGPNGYESIYSARADAVGLTTTSTQASTGIPRGDVYVFARWVGELVSRMREMDARKAAEAEVEEAKGNDER